MTYSTYDELNIWEQLIREAIGNGGRPQSDTDEDLIVRLRAIKQLLIHRPNVFEKTRYELCDGLQQGLSSQFILRFLADQQPLYSHAVPQEQGLVASLSELVLPFFQWLKSAERTPDERCHWIDRFESIASIQQASAFFEYLLKENRSIVHDDLMEVFLSHSEEGAQSRRLYVNRSEELLILAHVMGYYQLVDSALQPMILPLIVEATDNNVPIKKLETLLSLLSTASVQAQLLPLFPQQIALLQKWWRFAVAERVSVEQASEMLKIVLHVHDVQEHNDLIALIDTMIQAGIAAEVSADQWAIGITWLHYLESLAPESLLHRAVVVAQQATPRFFGSAWMMRFCTIDTLQADVLASLNDEDAVHAIHVYMQCSDERKAREYLSALAQMTNQPLVAYSVILEQASHLSEPLPYLQVMSELQQLYLDLPLQGRDAFQQLFDEQCSDCAQLLRNKDFLQLFHELPNLNHEYLKNAYVLWHKKPYCSMSELKEKMVFSLKIQEQLPGLDAVVMQEIINAPQQKKELLQQVLLPRQMSVKDVAAWWNKINTHQALHDPFYLDNVLKLQQQAIQLTDKVFSDLLDFDDRTKTDARRGLLHCVHHEEIVLPIEKKSSWWEMYFRSLSDWLNKGISIKPKTNLNQQHHAQAIQSLYCVAYAAEELHAIVAPSNMEPRVISAQLKQHLANYQSSYNASWWKSGDRKKLADKALFSLLKNGSTNYNTVFAALHQVMDGVVTMDRQHRNRNSKGYSRLYDIAVQLMSIALSEALRFDAARSHEYMSQVQDIMAKHQTLIGAVDVELPAFQHLQDMIAPANQPGFTVR